MITTAQELAMVIHAKYLSPLGGSITNVEPISALINALVLRRIDHYITSEKLKQLGDKPPVGPMNRDVQPIDFNGIMVETKRVNVGTRRF